MDRKELLCYIPRMRARDTENTTTRRQARQAPIPYVGPELQADRPGVLVGKIQPAELDDRKESL